MKKVFIVIVIFIVILIYIVSAHTIGKKREKQFFIHFDTTNISGKLEYIKIKYRLCAFKIQGIDDEYYFDPITGVLNDKKIFEYTAKKGDSIFKEAYSEILKLKKGENKVYTYKFRKLND